MNMQQKIENTLRRLVAIPSTSSNIALCREVIDEVKGDLSKLGLFIKEGEVEDHPWILATTQKTMSTDILLVAHLDVVPALEGLFTVRRKGTSLHGRGVYDMKFAAACYLELLREHHSELATMNIGVLFTTDEEIGGLSVKEVLASGLRAKIALLPDGGDNWAIEKRAKGPYGIGLTAQGKAAHGSRPWEGINALHTIMDVAQILRSKYPSEKPSDSTVSINQLIAGEAPNQIPEYASVAVDFRSFDKAEMDAFKLLIGELARIHNLETHIYNEGDPLVFDDTDPRVQEFMEVFERVVGHKAEFCESYGASDARYFGQYDIPCIVVQPHGGGRHSASEWIEATDLEKYYRLIETWIFQSSATGVASSAKNRTARS